MNDPTHSCGCGHTSSATPVQHPVDALVAEHEVILAVLEAMETQAKALQKGGPFDRELWAGFPEFLRNFADRCHHGKEEDLLFPALTRRGLPEPGGPIGVMKLEHTQGRELIKALDEAIQRSDARSVVSAAVGFVGLLRDHIAKENNVLFPIGKRLLEDAAVSELARDFERAEREIMGEGTHCKYLELAQQLCAKSQVEFAKRRGDALGGGCCAHH